MKLNVKTRKFFGKRLEMMDITELNMYVALCIVGVSVYFMEKSILHHVQTVFF